MFRHPEYYKELRKARNELAKRNAVKEDLACSGSSRISNKEEARAQLKVPSSNLDQAISDEASTEATSVRPGPGLSGKQQAASDSQVVNQVKLSSQSQASSSKRQASSTKLLEPQAASLKPQA